MSKEFKTQPETEREIKYLKSFTPEANEALHNLHVHLEKLLKQRDASFIFKAPAGAGKSSTILYCLEILKSMTEQEMPNNTIATSTPERLGFVNDSIMLSESSLPRTLCLVSSTNLSFYEKHLGPSPSIHICSSIELLAWEMIEPFQRAVLNYVNAPEWKLPQEIGNSKIIRVVFDEQLPAFENGNLHLSVYDVKKLFCLLLADPLYKKKFSWFFKQRYSTVLIDEYQTFPADILNALLSLLLKAQGQHQDVLLGLFGDPFQNVEFNTGYDLNDSRLLPIPFYYNLRSAPSIVNVLNVLRPESPQLSALQDQRGSVIFVSCSDYCDHYEFTSNSREILHNKAIKKLFSEVENFCTKNFKPGTYELFMLNEIQYAKALGFKKLHLRLKDQDLLDDPNLLSLFFFCYNFLEPLYCALKSFNVYAFFDALSPNRQPIMTSNDKKQWKKFYEELTRLRQNASVLEVLFFVNNCPLFDKPCDIISDMMLEAQRFKEEHPDISSSVSSIPTDIVPFLCQYSELISYIRVFEPLSFEHSIYSTFKTPGYSYDNVFIVTDRIWELFNYKKSLNSATRNENNTALERDILSFYDIISRARHNLYIFNTGEFTPDFETFCKTHLVHAHLCSYHEFKERFADLRNQQIAQGLATDNALITTVKRPL